MQSMTCPAQIVKLPRPSGQPNTLPISTNSSSIEMPSTTSGMTSGALTMATYSEKPRNLPMRARTKPAQVPMMTAAVAVSAAMRSDSHAADNSALSLNSDWYHLSEKPDHTVTRVDSLKEYTTRLMMGI